MLMKIKSPIKKKQTEKAMATQIKYIMLVFTLSSCSLFTPPDEVIFEGKSAEKLIDELQKK